MRTQPYAPRMSWTYETELPGDMTHTIQVQADRDDVDFNLIVFDATGNEVARDDSPAADATCTFETEEAGRYELRIELARGKAGFSLKASSRTRQTEAFEAPVPRADAPDEVPSNRTGLTTEEIEGVLAAHNRWRAQYGVPPLQWSDELSSVAQNWADELAKSGMQMRHRSPNDFGENIYWCAGRRATPDDVVDAWGNEVELYDEALNNWWPRAGHWSQVVWSTTTHVGGGVARFGGHEMWVCNYAPRGNWTGQRPY